MELMSVLYRGSQMWADENVDGFELYAILGVIEKVKMRIENCKMNEN